MITVKRFTASWCAPCRMLAPVLKSIEAEFPSVSFEVIDTEESPEEAKKYGILSIPAVLILKDGVVVDTIVGSNPKNKYVSALLSVLPIEQGSI